MIPRSVIRDMGGAHALMSLNECWKNIRRVQAGERVEDVKSE